MLQRGDMRTKYDLEGNAFKDLCCACCCGVCDLVQQDKESELRERELLVHVQQQVQPEKQAPMDYSTSIQAQGPPPPGQVPGHVHGHVPGHVPGQVPM